MCRAWLLGPGWEAAAQEAWLPGGSARGQERCCTTGHLEGCGSALPSPSTHPFHCQPECSGKCWWALVKSGETGIQTDASPKGGHGVPCCLAALLLGMGLGPLEGAVLREQLFGPLWAGTLA